MLGAIIKYIGLPIGERYREFIGAVGYVASYTRRAKDNTEHVAVEWFRPVKYRNQRISRSHFSLDRFEILSDGSPES